MSKIKLIEYKPIDDIGVHHMVFRYAIHGGVIIGGEIILDIALWTKIQEGCHLCKIRLLIDIILDIMDTNL